MKNLCLSFLLLLLIIGLGSCRNDFEFTPSAQGIEFSRDTIYLDTVFTNIGSSTYNLKVYNRSDEDISIPTVRLAEGEASNYRLNVDGRAGKSFENVEIFAKDSIFIFVETTLDIQELASNALEFLYTDQIVFEGSDNQEQVELVTLVKDAVFLFPQTNDEGITESLLLGEDEEGNEIRIEGFFLEDDELNFTNEKPYVIYGYAAVPSDRTLTIDAGARIHFHRDSGILVANNGTLLVNGALSNDPELQENEVIFESDRLEPAFDDVPGQWGAIWLTAGSTGHRIDHATIKNGTVGILMDSNDGTADPTLTIQNSTFLNHAAVGLLGRTATIDASNSVFGNAGQSSVYCNIGGRYNFTHCTIANYWQNSFRSVPALLIDNYVEVSETEVFAQDLEAANFNNCIIFGSNNLEFFVDRVDAAAFNFQLNNCLVRLQDTNGTLSSNPLFNFDDAERYNNILFNQEPDFFNTDQQLFTIGEASAANGTADPAFSALFPIDLLGIDRSTTAPDMGAYESMVFPEE